MAPEFERPPSPFLHRARKDAKARTAIVPGENREHARVTMADIEAHAKRVEAGAVKVE